MTTAIIVTLNKPNNGNQFRAVIWRGPKNGGIEDKRITTKEFPTIEQAENYAFKYRLSSLKYIDLR